MKQTLLALADKQFRDGNRAGTIEAINAFYALIDAEEQVAKLLDKCETTVVSESKSYSEKELNRAG